MKAVVVYDSKYGNTEKIAVAVGAEIGGRVLLVNEVKLADLNPRIWVIPLRKVAFGKHRGNGFQG